MMNDNSNFIKTIMKEELDNGVVDHILTRFPPEPNAYLHIGHARAIIMNFELAKCFDGATNLRFDDTNPSKEDTEYIEAIKKDIAWLGYTPKSIHYGSEYFERTYEKAKLLIKKGLAFVDDLTQEQLNATPKEVFEFLRTGEGSKSTSMYGIDDKYSLEETLKKKGFVPRSEQYSTFKDNSQKVEIVEKKK